MPSYKESSQYKVLTYDGHRAAQRPRIVRFESIEYEVIECESLYISTGVQTRSPVRRGYRVRCIGGRQFKLELTEGIGWLIEPIDGPYAVV